MGRVAVLTCASGECAKPLHSPGEGIRIVAPGEGGGDGAQAGLCETRATAPRHVPAAALRAQHGRRRGANDRL